MTPLREGGSLPALVEADDDGLYVLKFRGAGQGPLVLVAEVIAGELARSLGLPVPDLVTRGRRGARARGARPRDPGPDRREHGHQPRRRLPAESLPYSPAAGCTPTADLAAEIVWLDALVTNVDRTARNPNLLCWHGRLWLIDHGAALYRQHAGLEASDAGTPFPQVAEHVLLPCAGSIGEADERLAHRIDRPLLEAVVALVPEEWLVDVPAETYVDGLDRRLEAPRDFVQEAEHARRTL